jgi:hypothetical protein
MTHRADSSFATAIIRSLVNSVCHSARGTTVPESN